MTNAAGAFDFNFYLTNNGITLFSNHWVLVNLGINDMFSWRKCCAPAWSNVVVVPIHAAIDTVNGFPTVTEAISSHNTNVWTRSS